MSDLRLDHLWVVYPGDRTYSLTEKITVLPLEHITTDGALSLDLLSGSSGGPIRG